MLEILLCLIIIIAISPFVGSYIARVFMGQRVLLSPILLPLERKIYVWCSINKDQEQSWFDYTKSLLLFNALGCMVLYLIMCYQQILPLNPEHLPNVHHSLAFNTAVSFITNTNWQSYSGEITMSYFSQMLGLAVQNFLSAATGVVAVIALIRGIIRDRSHTIGNYCIDMVRCILYILLPLAIIVALVLVWQGVPQNFNPYTEAVTLEGGKQIIAQGPVASQESIKILGSNGGGFFNANSAHPYENPTPFSNWLELIMVLLIPAALPFSYSKMVKDWRQGGTIFVTMLILFILGAIALYWVESSCSLLDRKCDFSGMHSEKMQLNMEGKEIRFGIANSALWTNAITATSNGAANSMIDSFMPLSSMVAMINMMFGEVIFGGAGCGLYSMILYILLAVFVAGLMVGRTPEYLGKKIETQEIRFTMIAILVNPIAVLVFSAAAFLRPDLHTWLTNLGSHGFSEVFYAYLSAANNNGSAFAGLAADNFFLNISLAIVMLIGRFGIMIPILAIAGSLAAKKVVPASSGTLPTHGIQFCCVLIGFIIIVGGLTFFPVLVLGPILDHLSMVSGKLY